MADFACVVRKDAEASLGEAVEEEEEEEGNIEGEGAEKREGKALDLTKAAGDEGEGRGAISRNKGVAMVVLGAGSAGRY